MCYLNIPESAVSDYVAMQDRLGEEVMEISDKEFLSWLIENRTPQERATALLEDNCLVYELLGTLLATVLPSIENMTIVYSIAGEQTTKCMLAALRKRFEDECRSDLENRDYV
jgi:hypothetical protein